MRAAQSRNADGPIETRPLGKFTSARLLQLSKASCPMAVRAAGQVTVVKAVQSLNAKAPSFVSLVEDRSAAAMLHSAKQFAPIATKELGKMTSVREVDPSKARSPMVLTLVCERSILLIPLHPEKACEFAYKPTTDKGLLGHCTHPTTATQSDIAETQGTATAKGYWPNPRS